VVATGKYSVKSGVFNSGYIKGTESDGNFDTKAEFEKSVLLKYGVKEEDIILEDQSMHTRENVIFAKKKLEELHIPMNKIVVCCKNFHARRYQLTFSLVFSESEVLICPTDTQGITKENWYLSPDKFAKILEKSKDVESISPMKYHYRKISKIIQQ